MRKTILAACLTAAVGTAMGATMDEAARSFEAGRWSEAAAAYESVLAAQPENATARIRLARARAANGEVDAALAALTTWFESGNGVYQFAMQLPEFESLRADPRFVALVGRYKPCSAADYRQFDFWVGDWNVESATAPGTVSHNRITLINDGCTLREEYDTPQGYVGTSLNFYDSQRKVWHQTWIDNQGGALVLEGGLQGGDMVLQSAEDGGRMQRITWTPLPDGRVRQHWQSTSDGGKTWATAFDGTYTRRSALR